MTSEIINIFDVQIEAPEQFDVVVEFEKWNEKVMEDETNS